MQEKALLGPKYSLKFEINSSKNDAVAIHIFEISQVNGTFGKQNFYAHIYIYIYIYIYINSSENWIQISQNRI